MGAESRRYDRPDAAALARPTRPTQRKPIRREARSVARSTRRRPTPTSTSSASTSRFPRRKAQSGENPNDDAGWFFVIKERPGEPRFGLELSRSGPLTIFDQLTWDDALARRRRRAIPARRQPCAVGLTTLPRRTIPEMTAERRRPNRRRRAAEFGAMGLSAVPRARVGRGPRRRDARLDRNAPMVDFAVAAASLGAAPPRSATPRKGGSCGATRARIASRSADAPHESARPGRSRRR